MNTITTGRRLLTALGACAVALGAMAQPLALPAGDAKKIKDAILQDVQKQQIDKQPEVQNAIRTAQEALLIRAWERQTLKTHPVTPAHREAAYKELLAQLGNQEYRLYHITLAEQAQASALIQRLQAGLSWNQVEIPATAQGQPPLKPSITNWVNTTMVQPEYREVLKLLKSGQVYPTPIKSATGWHVVGLVETRDLATPTLEQLKGPVDQLAERKAISDRLTTLIQRP